MIPAKILIYLFCLSLGFGQAERNSKRTQLKTVLPRIFTRRKRALLFPPGSFVKFTANFATGLLSKFPTGISFVIEEAVYYPIPGTINDIYPKRFLPTTTTKKPEKLPDSFVYIPGTDWRFKAKTLPKPKWRTRPLKTHRIDDDSYANPYKWQQWNHKAESKWKQAKWNKWTTPKPQWSGTWNEDYHRHYYGHRDRRDLFDHFSKLSSLFGLDVKSCILRTICDSKRLLLPPGYSMLQDMLRLVFTMPRIDGLEDDYTRIMAKDADACALELKTKCNMSLLIWLLSGGVN